MVMEVIILVLPYEMIDETIVESKNESEVRWW